MSLNYPTIESFRGVVNWLLNIRHDDQRAKFCLISLKFLDGVNLPPDLYAFGAKLAGHMRDSDLIALDGQTYWCLLPTDRIDAIQQRLAQIVCSATQENLDSKDYSLSSYLFPRYSLQRIKNSHDLFAALESSPALLPNKQIDIQTDGKSCNVYSVPLYHEALVAPSLD